jgi:hypothetical protein
MFIRTLAEAARMACMPDYELLRRVLVELKRQHPQPPPGPAALDDPATSDFKSVRGTHKQHGPYTAEAQRTLGLSAGPVHDPLEDFLINRGMRTKAIRNCGLSPLKDPSFLLCWGNVEPNHADELCEALGQLRQPEGKFLKAGLVPPPVHAAP